MAKSFKRGFTLIELLVVIAIIGILASVILASLNGARLKARDAIRKNDLAEIAKALELYYDNHGTYVVSGTGANGAGVGWLSYVNPSANYPKAVTQGLTDDGDLGGAIIDPLGIGSYNTTHAGYMIAISGDHYTLWADLENPSSADTATLNNCYLSNYDGYPGGRTVPDQTNYCISN